LTATVTKPVKLHQRIIWRYDLFSQILLPKKAMSKRTFLCFNAAFTWSV